MSKTQTTVLEVGGLHWATSEPVIEKGLLARPGVLAVQANAVSQTATVTYDAEQTSVADLVSWVSDCGYHCQGRSVPEHVCDPLGEPTHDEPEGHAGHCERPADGELRGGSAGGQSG